MVNYRKEIIDYYKFLASNEERKKESAIEVINIWYHDTFIPFEEDKDIYNPGVWENWLDEWSKCFNNKELILINQFKVIMENICNSTGKYLTEDELENHPLFESLIIKAKECIALLDK